jgi:periplasmic protein TonB
MGSLAFAGLHHTLFASEHAMPPIVKDTETLSSPVAPGAETGTLLQMPAASRPAAEIGGRVQPVALEVPVSLNGARTVHGSDKREPFSESTRTVLVFGNGAVIRLTSSVAPGQLLFLTNEKTKREVVCQVVKSKSYRNVSGYVELEFTEPAVGFWGVRFPSDRPGSSREAAPAPLASALPVTSQPAPKNVEVKGEEPAPVFTSIPVPALFPDDPEAAKNDFPADSFPFAPPTVAPKLDRTDKAPSTSVAVRQDDPKSLDDLLAELAVKPLTPKEPTMQELKLETARLQQQLSSFLFEKDQQTKLPEAIPAVKPFSAMAAASLAKDLAEKVLEAVQDVPVLPREIKTQSLPQPTLKPLSETHLEEIEIPAWLVPKSSSTQTSGHSEEPAAEQEWPAATESLPAESLNQYAAESESSVGESDLSVPTFASGLATSHAEDSESPSGSKKGLWFGLAASVLVLLAGGFWYLQQNGSLTGGVALGSQSSVAKADNVPANKLTERVPQSRASSATASAISNAVKTDAEVSAPPAVRPPQDISSSAVAPGNEEISALAAQPPAPQSKKPSLGDLRLASPVIHRKGISQDGGVAAPTLSDSQDLPAAAAMGASFADAGSQPAAPSAPLPVGGDVTPAKLFSSVQPFYSPLAKSQHVSGDVKVDALIDTNGRVTTMKVISGPALLQQSAMDALRQWRYHPAMLNGSAVPTHLTVTLQFRLQ